MTLTELKIEICRFYGIKPIDFIEKKKHEQILKIKRIFILTALLTNKDLKQYQIAEFVGISESAVTENKNEALKLMANNEYFMQEYKRFNDIISGKQTNIDYKAIEKMGKQLKTK